MQNPKDDNYYLTNMPKSKNISIRELHMNDCKLVKFIDDEFSLDVNVDYKKDTVWLTQRQMSELFSVTIDNISLHIKNIIKENELNNSTIEESSVVQVEDKREVRRKRLLAYYIFLLKIILSLTDAKESLPHFFLNI